MDKQPITAFKNPIFWRELVHQGRRKSYLRRFVRVGGVILVLGIVSGVPLTLRNFQIAAESTVNIALVTLWAIHALVATRCLIAGATSISREHVGQTWDALILTGIPAHQILWGKWRATMRRIAPWMLMLGVVRLAMLPTIVGALMMRLAYFYYATFGTAGYQYAGGYGDNFYFYYLPWAARTGVIFAVLLTLLDVALCVAIGVASSALARRDVGALVMAFLGRFMPVALFIGLTRHERGTNAFLWYRFPAFAFADGGTSQLYQFMVPVSPWTMGRADDALPVILAVAVSLALMLIVALAAAWIAIQRSGALFTRIKQPVSALNGPVQSAPSTHRTPR